MKNYTDTRANLLLNSLTTDEHLQLQPWLRSIALRRGETVAIKGEPINAVLFPDAGLISLMATSADGDSLEVGMVGCEGVVGLSAVFGGDSMPWEAIVRSPGSALVMTPKFFRSEMAKRGALWNALADYSRRLEMQTIQLSFCNHHHSIQRRCARWLLMAAERLGSNRLDVTHNVLSLTLGVRRPSVSIAIESLREAGLVEPGRGHLKVIDRTGLEAAACDCYHHVLSCSEQGLARQSSLPMIGLSHAGGWRRLAGLGS